MNWTIEYGIERWDAEYRGGIWRTSWAVEVVRGAFILDGIFDEWVVLWGDTMELRLGSSSILAHTTKLYMWGGGYVACWCVLVGKG